MAGAGSGAGAGRNRVSASNLGGGLGASARNPVSGAGDGVEADVARRKVEAFGERFGQVHVWFACHAAMPLALTTDLLYGLWGYFSQDSQGELLEIPWVAVADLLMSDLCADVGHELYAMDGMVREVLLQQLEAEPRFGAGRMKGVAEFLLRHTAGALRSDEGDRRDWAQTQRWAALAYVRPELAARELAEGLGTGVKDSAAEPSETLRKARLVQRLAVPLGEYDASFVGYARGMEAWQLGEAEAAKAAFGQLPEGGKNFEVAGVPLGLPKDLKAGAEERGDARPRSTKMTRRRLLQGAGLVAAGTVGVVLWDLQRKWKPWLALPQRATDPTQFAAVATSPFSFEVVTVDGTGQEVSRVQGQAEAFQEDLGNQVFLEMVAIPGGTFEMGSPETELERETDEGPQHEVTVPSFFMGKYPVTQAEYEAVMGNNPSNFKGADRSVDSVSWEDAMQFCQKLSQLTEREYRLPSEAEWEYACRAGTTTPFHFGETITTDLANYYGSSTYGQGPKGVYRQETTPYRSFKVANAFGLFDMHGNVWEWCADSWHNSYEGAPTDGSAWIDNDNRSQNRMLRGGSWLNSPGSCRSAIRYNVNPANRNLIIGFRVVLSGSRT